MKAAMDIAARVTDLTHRYGDVCAVDGISLEIPAGARVGLIGPDGVGKSTLMGLLAGARKLQSGQIEALGRDLAVKSQRRDVGPRIAYMPQGLGKNLYAELSIAENLAFFGRLFGLRKHQRATRIASLTEATGLKAFLNRPAGKLSGGMKQKLGLCCALIHDPDFLILDEPTTGVDPLSRRQFWDLISTIMSERAGMTLLVSTSYMEEATQFDWLIAMNAGRVIGAGTPDELMARAGVDDLEAAYVALLPQEDQHAGSGVVIPPRTETDGAQAIIAEGLTRKFGDFTAVENVDFSIERGEIFGFLGSNGCGKTTTMKMLTGLLTPSAGRAYLFGKPVDAGSHAMRRRVGYMSQSFSLYGELTVRQNLDLHARLFKLERWKARARVAELMERFRLERYGDDLAERLPLGVRQRLSLAVAILHEPEMLILDEPTSGVDPLARDEFWRLLVELSRNENVTIFVSTHFMNEAMRCDRISLMHAGKVLAVGTPASLIEGKGEATLEDAFIAYMQDAHSEGAAEKTRVAPSSGDAERNRGLVATNDAEPVQDDFSHSSPTGISLMRLMAYALRETKEILRDPVRLGFAFVGSTILLFIFSYGITTDVEEVAFAVLDQDRTPASRSYIQEYRGSRYFLEGQPIVSQDMLEARLAANDITVALQIPPSFGRDLARGASPEVSAWIDGSNTMRAATIEGYVAGVHGRFLQNIADTSTRALPSSAPTGFATRYLYNPTFESIYAIGPAVPAMLLILFPAILMAVSVVREKEMGTITNFYVTPSTRLEFLVGKQLPYIAIAMANFAIMSFIVVFVFDVPLKGSLFALTLGALVYAAATTGYGLLIATFTSSQVAAVFATAILSMMPTFLFSGFLQPVSSLEGGAKIIGTLWPTTYYMHLSVGSFTKGLGLNDVGHDIIALMLFVPAFIAIAAAFLQQQER
ncbi:MAG: ribosome-associated ATPase/putative transporter RbbA [Pseudomonadota bacterium]